MMGSSSSRPKAAVIMALVIGLTGGACAKHLDEATLTAYLAAASAYDRGDLDEARELAGKISEANPGFLPGLMLLGKTRYLSGDDAGAIAALEPAIAMVRGPGEAGLWLARSYRAAQRNDEARNLIERLVASDPRNTAALRLAASIALDAREGAVARVFLDRAIETGDEVAMACLDRAVLEWASGDSEATIADIDRCLALLPEGASAWAAALSLRSAVVGTSKP